uniref:uncharacterized protein LOC124059268 n=1 Tax=Scatophagus argus TaxID=75038 RepID=UPI001ED8499A|nr:uncharacterized protein LOC124059268 [Scatophagus argus]
MDIGEASVSEQDCVGAPQQSSTPLGFDDNPQTQPLPVTSSSISLLVPPSTSLCNVPATANISQNHIPSCQSDSHSSQQPVSEINSPPNSSESQPCCASCKNLACRLQVLEAKVKTLMSNSTPKQSASTSKLPTFTPKGSVQKFEHVQKGRMPENLCGKIILDFEKFILGPRTGRKDIENARQARSHAQRFCNYLLGGCLRDAGSTDLLFLRQIDKIRMWPTYLKHKGYAITTIGNMLFNVTRFLTHVENKFQSVSKLRTKDLVNMIYEIKRVQKEVRRDVVVHRQKVKRCKTKNQLGPSVENHFLMAAKNTIPTLLDSVKKDQHLEAEHIKLMGYLMGYLCMLTGHRSVVMTNMTKENVLHAERSRQGFHITVDEHKTVRTYGQASLFLNKDEYSWLSQLIDILSVRRRYAKCNYIFVTYKGKQIEKPVHFLKEAWRDAGLEGNITFNQIRSSVSTEVSSNFHLKKMNLARVNLSRQKTSSKMETKEELTEVPPVEVPLEVASWTEVSTMPSGDAPMEEATQGKVSEIPPVQIPLEEASRTEVSTMPSGDPPMEEATRGKASEIPPVQIPLEEGSRTEVSTMPSGDAPMEEATQGKVSQILPVQIPLEEASRTEVSTMPSGDPPMEEATRGKASEIPPVQIPLEEASRTEVSTMPSGDPPMEEATRGKASEIPPVQIPLEEASRTEVSTMPSGDAPMEEATQGKVSQIPPVQIPLEEASWTEVCTMPSGDAPMGLTCYREICN